MCVHVHTYKHTLSGVLIFNSTTALWKQKYADALTCNIVNFHGMKTASFQAMKVTSLSAELEIDAQSALALNQTSSSKPLHTPPSYTTYPYISETQLVNPIYRWSKTQYKILYVEWYIHLSLSYVSVNGIEEWGLLLLVNKLISEIHSVGKWSV